MRVLIACEFSGIVRMLSANADMMLGPATCCRARPIRNSTFKAMLWQSLRIVGI